MFAKRIEALSGPIDPAIDERIEQGSVSLDDYGCDRHGCFSAAP